VAKSRLAAEARGSVNSSWRTAGRRSAVPMYLTAAETIAGQVQEPDYPGRPFYERADG